MKPRDSLQTIIDPFVRSCDGEIVAEILEQKGEVPLNADYLFRKHGVIAELKALERDSFGEPFRRKMGNLMGSWQQRGLLVVYGTQRIDLHQLPQPCQQEALDVIEEPLQRVLTKANQQIRSTKELLNMPAAKGLLIVASDGNEDLPPSDVWFFFTRLLQKKKSDGTPQFSSVHSLVYLNPRMPALLPGTKQPALLWMSGPRQAEGYDVISLLTTLGDAWPKYMEKTMGVSFPQVDFQPTDSHKLKFAGVTPRMPVIQVTDTPPKEQA